MRDCKESGAHDYEVVDGRNRDECGAQDDVRDCFPRKRRARLRGRFVRPEFEGARYRQTEAAWRSLQGTSRIGSTSAVGAYRATLKQLMPVVTVGVTTCLEMCYRQRGPVTFCPRGRVGTGGYEEPQGQEGISD